MSPEKPVMMADIARHLQLARSTVSMALRDHPDIAPATRRRVQAAAARLGYRTNPLVSALMANVHAAQRVRHDTVLAMITDEMGPISWHRRPLMSELHRGIQSQADRHGYLLQEFRLGEPDMSPVRLASILRARGIPGVILAPVPATRASRFEAWSDFAVVTIGWSLTQSRLPRASFHHFQNILLAWDTLAARGYRRIGLVYALEQSRRSALTYLGGFLARSHTRMPNDRVQPLAVDVAESMTADLFRQWKEQERPDAIIVTDAAYFVPIARQVASIPEELSLVALETGAAPPGTAGVDEQSFRVGAAAVDILIEQLHHNQRGIPEIPTCIHVPGVWCDGVTIRPAA